MSNASQSGPGFRSVRPDWWFYDQLPPTARAALANAAFNWSAGSIHSAWRRGVPGYKTGADIAQAIAKADARQIEKDRERVWNFSNSCVRTKPPRKRPTAKRRRSRR